MRLLETLKPRSLKLQTIQLYEFDQFHLHSLPGLDPFHPTATLPHWLRRAQSGQSRHMDPLVGPSNAALYSPMAALTMLDALSHCCPLTARTACAVAACSRSAAARSAATLRSSSSSPVSMRGLRFGWMLGGLPTKQRVPVEALGLVTLIALLGMCSSCVRRHRDILSTTLRCGVDALLQDWSQ